MINILIEVLRALTISGCRCDNHGNDLRKSVTKRPT